MCFTPRRLVWRKVRIKKDSKMLTYLILTTRAILMETVIAGAIAGYTRKNNDKFASKIMTVLSVAGLIAAIVMSVFKNNTNRVSSSFWNNVIYVASIIAMLVVLICVLSKKDIIKKIKWTALSVFMAMMMLYALPEVFSYPHQVLLSERTIISTDFLYDMIGMGFGIIIAIVMFFSAFFCMTRLEGRGSILVLVVEMLLMTLRYLAGFFTVLMQNGTIKSNHTLFLFVIFIKNHTDQLMLASIAVFVATALLLIFKSFNVNEPYRNPAQHRKILAKWLRVRRWSVTLIAAAVCGMLVVTIVDAYNSQDVTLSPIEDCESDGDNMIVSFEQVSDGHLHRFGYESDNGITIRFIVIQKPNSTSYGVGLDACDICGETGYYERDGQVVCNLCDVVMNISTIGFKGGCNPIVIPYDIKNGQIIVPIDGLLEYESEFK